MRSLCLVHLHPHESFSQCCTLEVALRCNRREKIRMTQMDPTQAYSTMQHNTSQYTINELKVGEGVPPAGHHSTVTPPDVIERT